MSTANLTAGAVGKGLYFDGVDDYVQISRPVQDDFTIAFWMKTTDTSMTDSALW
jgi:hypothetical protein